MHLPGQLGSLARGQGPGVAESGYAMAVLLVTLSVMSVALTVAMPVWKQMSQREKEAELIFRGQQYARAIELLQRKMPGALPPNLNLLVDQKFLRKRYKDPITGEDFDPVSPVQTVPGAQPGGQQPPGRGQPGFPGGPAGRGQPGPAPGRPGVARGPGGIGGPSISGGVQAGIIGVVSKSKDRSIRLYNGRNHYNEWIFQAIQRTQTPGGGAPGTNVPGQRGGRGQPPPGGGRGQPDSGRGGRGAPPSGGRGPVMPGGPFSPGRPPGN